MQNFIYDENLTTHVHTQLPYAKDINIQAGQSDGELVYFLPYKPVFLGNTYVPALHGGLIGGFMECCANIFLMQQHINLELSQIIDFSLDYLRPGQTQDIWAKCSIIRKGVRIANIDIVAWQSNPQKPIATARAHFLLTPEGKA